MMKKYITVIVLAVAVLFTTACKDFLVEEPILSQSTSLTLSDFNGLNKAVAGAYAPLADGQWYGAMMILESEMRAGNAMRPINSDFTSGRMMVPYDMSYNESSTSGLWGYAYYVISAVNNVLDVIEKGEVELVKDDITQQDVDNLQAEALALRALAHFDCLRTYARTDGSNDKLGIPLILTPQSPDDQPARNTVTEVLNQVVADLTKAEGLMSSSYVRAGGVSSKCYITIDVIRALLARVYLYKKDYSNAAAYATKVIDSGNYKLWTAKEYPTVWNKDAADKGGEVIFEVYGATSNSYDEYWEGPSHMTNPIGYGDCAASFDLMDLFEDGDVRGSKGIRGTDEGKVMFCTDPDEKSLGQMWTMKYQGKGKGDAVSTPDVSNVIVIRLSEMYLIRAEASANGAGNTAVSDLNAIRSNRGASLLSSAGSAAVALERRLELNFEGHTWFDLARTTATLNYSDGVVTRNLTSSSKEWALPIPKRETDVNENLEQNPGF